MRNLILFFRKNYFIFLFLLLEVVSLIFFFRTNNYQNAAMFDWTFAISGVINSTYRDITEYFSLKRTNLILSEENAILQARMPEALYLTDTVVFSRSDSLLQSEYRFINARVISNTTNRRNNFQMINKGALHGIEPHMGVIIGNKIVGQVVGVSRHFSWILSMLHKESKISAKFLKNNQLVSVEWPGGDFRTGIVKEIPKHLLVLPGDTIVTSGNSEVFPNGILIGTIEHLNEKRDENFNTATLTFLTDFNSLGYVEVVVDMFREEKEQLKASFKEL
ncbi:MAG: rod shape-determining protein MreC [Bacteroidales bacterium]|nr:rod shape-determining protein MreC [Deltaproteobacteria bacterium]MBL7137737.1 rod shape-determining protein MreC [Bacteroidales bacterium]